MPKAYTGNDVETALKKKGFERSDGDHRFLRLFVDGKATNIRTKISHGRKDYTGFLWSQLVKQIKLPSDELREMLGCAINQQEYVDRLKLRGHI